MNSAALRYADHVTMAGSYRVGSTAIKATLTRVRESVQPTRDDIQMSRQG
jgi:hypothetical protein